MAIFHQAHGIAIAYMVDFRHVFVGESVDFQNLPGSKLTGMAFRARRDNLPL